METNSNQVKVMNGEEGGSSEQESPNHKVCDVLIRWAIKNGYLPWRVMRRVNKAWDESVCSAFTLNTNIVYICENKHPKSESFLKLLKGRRRRVKGQLLAMPFRIHLEATTLTKRHFLSSLERYLPHLTVTGLDLGYDDRLSDNFLRPLRKILQSHSETLTKLEIIRHQNSEILPKKFHLDQFKFPSLKILNTDFNEELEFVLDQAKGLERLSLQFISLGPTELMSPKLLRLLKDVPFLEFNIIDSDRNFPMKTFAQLPLLPNLKRLGLVELAETEVEDAVEIISEWSSSLEGIKFSNSGIPWHSLPVFPKLRLMFVKEDFCHFEPEKFPSLEEIHLFKPPILCEQWVPHLGVKILEFHSFENSYVVDEKRTRQCYGPFLSNGESTGVQPQ